MGQHFHPVFLDDDFAIIGRIQPQMWAYKLAEVVWIGDSFVLDVERALTSPTRLVWAGQYADPEPDTDPVTELDDQGTLREYPPTLHALSEAYPNIAIDRAIPIRRFLLNHDQRTFIDKHRSPPNPDDASETLHLLPALTAEGNGRGSGDLPAHPLIGTWARARISVTDTVPDGFTETTFVSW
ncbi:hypothetical protein ACIO52_02885 [Nocardia sp. NPDC087230]|uniref:hypothetical protein n=1 Tax=Nocardia sp. NPDC087230 TaxID=3364331 RepID=UPI00381CD012